MPFAESEPSDRFINFVSFATGVLAFECAFNSFTSAAVYSLRTFFFAFLATSISIRFDGLSSTTAPTGNFRSIFVNIFWVAVID